MDQLEYFNTLQIEWIMNWVRIRVYPNSEERYLSKVLEYKKKQIIDIAARSKFESIFDSKLKWKRVYHSLFNENGLAFHYHEKNLFMKHKDFKFYYQPGARVVVNNYEFKELSATIESYSEREGTVVINARGSQHTVSIGSVLRPL